MVVPYIFRGQDATIPADYYSGVTAYLAGRPPSLSLDPVTYYTTYINDPVQDRYMAPFVDEVRTRCGSDQDECVRTAIAIVQHRPYNHTLADQITAGGRSRLYYPYETLRSGGVCSDKSLLLAYLLKKLNYGTVLFLFGDEHHMAVGIRCPPDYDFRDSGYCFAETTAPAIVTDENLIFNLVYPLKLKNFSNATMIVVHGGEAANSFNSVHQEAEDALVWARALEHPELAYTSDLQVRHIMYKYGMDAYKRANFG